MFRFTTKVTVAELSLFSVAVTNEWDPRKDQPRPGLVYLSNSSLGCDRCLLKVDGTPFGYEDRHRPKPLHVVDHNFGQWLGYEPALTCGFYWQSVHGSTATFLPAQDEGWFDVTCEPGLDPKTEEVRMDCAYMRKLSPAAGWTPPFVEFDAEGKRLTHAPCDGGSLVELHWCNREEPERYFVPASLEKTVALVEATKISQLHEESGNFYPTHRRGSRWYVDISGYNARRSTACITSIYKGERLSTD